MPRLLLPCLVSLFLIGCPDDGNGDDDDGSPLDDDSAGDDDDATPGDDDDATADDDDATADDDDSAGDDDDSAATPAFPELTIACEDALDDVYVTPQGLPPWDETVLGDVVRCAPEEVLSAAEVEDRLVDVGVTDVVPAAGAAVYRVAYRTTRWEGVEGIGSAKLLLPDALVDGEALPVVVVNHGTVGLADHCAPSKYPTISAEMSLAFAGRGFVVIAPDYAGLGTEGVQGYGDNADTAHSALDAAKAVRNIVDPAALAPGTIGAGHSQGGGAALSMHAFASSYGEGDLLGIISFAPGWTTDTEGLYWVSHYPTLVPWSMASALPVGLQMYADAANHLGAGHEVDYFDDDIAADAADLIANQCVLSLSIQLPLLASTFSTALDDEFIITVAACTEGHAACGPPGEEYVQRAETNVVPLDPSSGPVLVLSGMLDDRSTPEDVACIVESALDDGADVQACTDAGAEHIDITARQASFAVEWAVALAQGTPLPPCAESDLPTCE